MTWVLIKTGEPGSNFSNHQEWQLDSADDIETIPPEAENAAPGSKAWTGDFAHIYNKANDGTWPDIMGDGDSEDTFE